MAESCVFKPTVRNKEGKEVNSRLFDNLLHFSSNDREFAKKYYFIGTNDEFLRTNARHVEYDENGEITFKSLKNLVSLDISSEKIINQLNKDISSGEHEYGEAVSLMTSFNNNSPYNDEYMATINTVEGGKANLQVVRKTTANQTALEETLTNKSLFDRIKQAVERIGGSIDFIDENYSKYDTVNARKAESGLYNVIFLSRKKFYRRNSDNKENPYSKDISIGPPEADFSNVDAAGTGVLIPIYLNGEYIGETGLNNALYHKDKGISIKGEYIEMPSVGGSNITIEKEYRGKGYGKAAYFELAKFAANNGKILRSAPDKSRTPASTRVWESLVRDGYAKKVDNRYEIINSTLNDASKVVDENGETYATAFTADMAEEAGHFAVGALGNNPLVKRLESLCTPEVQESILKDHYRDVQGRKNPRRETAGFLVGQYIMDEVDQESTLGRLAGRIVNLAKRMFYRLTLDDVSRMREEAKAIAKNIARGFMSGDNAGSIENALENKEILYSSVDSVPVSSFKDVIQQLNLLASEMSAVDKTLYRKWKDIEANTAIGRLFENPSFFADMAAIDGLSVALTQLADSVPEMIDMLDSVNYNPDEVPANAKKLRQVSLFVQESIAIMGIIDNMLTSDEVQLKEDARDALDKAYKNLSSLIKGADKLEVNLLKKERKLYLSFLKDIYGGEYVERAARVVFNFNKRGLERVAESREYLSKAMESLDRDDNFMNRYITSMANSSDIINQLAYKTKASANKFADENTIKAWNDIRTLEQRVKKAKVDTKKLLEVSAKDGKLTGNYISKYNWGDWENDWYEFKNKCKENFLNDPSIEGKTQIEREYLWDVYFRPLAKDWHKSHSTYDQTTQRPMPNNSYRNHNYDRLTDTEKTALDDILELKGSLDDLLIYQSYNGEMIEAAHTHLYRMPQFRGSTQNRIENLKMTNPLGKAISGAIRQNLINTFTITSEDRDYGSAMTHNTIDEDVFSDRLDFEKEKVKRVPLYGINKLKDMSELSTDIFNGLLQYAAMANTYVATSSVVDILETGRDVLANRRVKGLKREVERDKKSRVFGRYCDFLDAQVYNLYTNSKLKFGQIALTKVIGFFGGLASKVFLGGNVAGGMVNVMTGFNEITKEAIAGEVYTLADLTKANALYFKHLPENWLEAGMGVKNNKVSLFMKRFNVQNNLDTETRNWSTRESRLARLNPFGNNLMLPYKSGDHYMQSMSYLAAANHYKFLDTDGKTISLWDALEVKNIDDSNPKAGKTLELKEGVLYIDPETKQTREWNLDDEVKFQNLCRETNNRMHGIYNRMDKTAFHNTWYGQAALAMRGYALGLLYRRFSSNQYSVALGRESEGSLVTASKVFVNMFGGTKNFIPSLRALLCPFGDSVKNSLLGMGFSVEQYRNMRRNWADFALIGMLWVLKALTAKSEDDDDDDDTISGLIYYFASRLYMEQNAYNTPWGIWQEQKSVLDWMPSGVSVAGQILDISRLMITQEEYKTSSATHEKGDKKWEYKIGSYIPYYRSTRVLDHPYEAAKSYEYGRATYK